MTLRWKKYTLEFKRPSGTSRGVLQVKDSYFIELTDGYDVGLGECGLLRGLSYDDKPDYEDKLNWLAANIDCSNHEINLALSEYPSIRAGLEMARLDLKATNHELFPSDFTDGFERQPINGLVWMGKPDFMIKQVKEKIEQGFLVIKMKIGAINFEDELKIIRSIRQEFGPHEIQIRVDANGAFEPYQALEKLSALDELRVHSIEQPIKAGQHDAMAQLCEVSPLPIALDEELIGVFKKEDKEKLLDKIKPHFIILKPSLLGGFACSEEWIDLAESRACGWWVTSALESNLGLNAIAQWNYNLYGLMASGLGTGSLYTNNFTSPLKIVRGTLAYDPEKKWQFDLFEKEKAP